MLAALIFGAMPVLASLAIFRRINSLQANLRFTHAQRITINHMNRAIAQVKSAKALDQRQHHGHDGEKNQPIKNAAIKWPWSRPHEDFLSQRAALLSSDVLASTQAPPCGPSSSFQNGALVFSQSMRK